MLRNSVKVFIVIALSLPSLIYSQEKSIEFERNYNLSSIVGGSERKEDENSITRSKGGQKVAENKEEGFKRNYNISSIVGEEVSSEKKEIKKVYHISFIIEDGDIKILDYK